MALNVAFKRPEVIKLLPLYQLIRDCLEQQVKVKGELYLPRPNASDMSPDNRSRYDAYLQRAVFYDVTSRTLNGIVGQVFTNDPEVLLPELLKPLEKDANGNGVGLVQHSKEALQHVLSVGRCGLLVDYPKTQSPTTRQQLLEGKVKPTINTYSPENIINWQTEKVGAQQILTLVVLCETYAHKIDMFQFEERTQYRVLRLDNTLVPAIYVQDIYREEDVTADGKPVLEPSGRIKREWPDMPSETMIPLASNAKPLEAIPFTFVGAVNNDPSPDPAPLYSLADLNIAHYRNSADYEESVYTVGQPTYVVSGLSQEWYTKVMKSAILVGSRSGIPLPVGADAKILQVEPNTMAKEAMDQKESQMKAIGAKLIEDKQVAQTATEANIANGSETSVLATGAKNVSSAYKFALEQCALFVGAPVSEETLRFELNTEFAVNSMTAQERQQLIAEWVAGAITFTEMRLKFHESGIATQEDEVAQAELDKATARKADEAANAAATMAKATNAVGAPAPGPVN